MKERQPRDLLRERVDRLSPSVRIFMALDVASENQVLNDMERLSIHTQQKDLFQNMDNLQRAELREHKLWMKGGKK